MKKQNAIEFIDICKYFGEIKANQDISFEVEKGTIHALIGENGAGKSTLMSILFGLYQPDKGTIKVNDKEVLIKGPNDANNLGIGMVHQHFKLVDVYTNLQNIILGDEDVNSVTKAIDYKPAIQKIKTIQEAFNLNFDLNRMTGKETVATQQKVEIMKMLYRDSEILIFDEPTAVLTDEEIQGLLETFKLFKEQGKTILFISHKLAEIKEVADNATVIRHGKVMGNFSVKDVSIQEMAEKMVGGEVEVVRNEYTDTSNNEVILEIKNASTSGEKRIKNLSLEVRAGEIVAIAGVEGNGQRDLEYAISGMKPLIAGEINYRKTPLITERVKLLQKTKTKTFFTLLSLSLLLFVLGIIFFVVKSNKPDIQAILNVFAGSSLFFGLLFSVIALNLKFHFTKIFKKIPDGKEKYEAKLGKKGFYLFKSCNYLAIALASLGFILSLIFVLSKTMLIHILILILFVLAFLAILGAKFISHKNFRELIVSPKAHLLKISIFEALCAIVALGLIIVASLTIVFLGAFALKLTLLILGFIFVALIALNSTIYYSVTSVENKNLNQDSKYFSISEYGVYDISKLAFSFIPSDRHKHGLVLDYNIKSNTILRRIWDTDFQKFGFFKNKKIKLENDEIIRKYDVRGARKGLSMARSLSGGNQQKFIVGREMNAPHEFILIVQPTRGLDVGAIKNIHEKILEEKKQGKAILLISYKLDEVLALADKIGVINGGEILVVKDAKDLTRTEIGVYMAHNKQKESQSETFNNSDDKNKSQQKEIEIKTNLKKDTNTQKVFVFFE
ncbi:ABC transporter ATP-binding protein [Mycoplasmopsis gallopavonis]|uniref:Simple sugar ABC transporter ATP-binding protein,P59-like protein n=1 Tax=Mycoplasmopsis gallopavonis TaxID=76629 RepID=A0A449AYZ3_9BACT|nr:ATP-binding cassette domain-containing protein [Mycoplasmopsis gallopavonis]RIV16639.1 ATP-binding cassette domain-containing protein [Mycoplasmopsis gallopavonis]VEU72695.1 simple sugar ABC transporter ATP-binding protein,P59-like protein [Mycoplasmopsis gallopavonis]